MYPRGLNLRLGQEAPNPVMDLVFRVEVQSEKAIDLGKSLGWASGMMRNAGLRDIESPLEDLETEWFKDIDVDWLCLRLCCAAISEASDEDPCDGKI